MEQQKRVMAVHDISCVGRCSLTVALPILSAAGLETSVLPTAILSTHTGGFEGYTYRDLTEDFRPVYKHWADLGVAFDAIYSGFLGSFEQIALVEELFEAFDRPGLLRMVDPVMADNGKLYTIYSPEMAKGMAGLCAKADLVVPNLTEAALILDEPYKGENRSQNEIEDILRRLCEMGPKQAVLTGVSFEEGKLGAAAYDASADTFSYAFCNRIGGYFHGTGDVFGSALLGALMRGKSLEQAIGIAVSYTALSIEKTVEDGKEARFGPCFERALGDYIKTLG